MALTIGLVVFTLTAAWMRHAALPDATFFEVQSGQLPAPSAETNQPTPLVFRVASRTVRDRSTQPASPVRIEAVQVDGRPHRFEAHGHSPAVVTINPPTGASVTLTVGAPSPARFTFEASSSPPPPSPLAQAAQTPTRRGAHHLDLIPEGGDLVAGLDNRVFVRLLDLDLRPISGAPIAILHPSLPSRRVDLLTDRHGLAELRLKADRPNYDLRVELTAGTLVSHTIQLLPVGRELTLSLAPEAAPGATTTARFATLRRSGTLSCELLDGASWLWARDIDLDGRPHLDLEVPLPLHPSGARLDLQCALSARSPGLAWVSRPLRLATIPSPSLQAALEATQTARPRTPPRLIHSTREAELAAVTESRDSGRRLVMMALVSVLAAVFLAGFAYLVIRIRDTKRRLTDALRDEPSLAPRELDALTRTRGLFVITAALALALAWLAAIASLLA